METDAVDKPGGSHTFAVRQRGDDRSRADPRRDCCFVLFGRFSCFSDEVDQLSDTKQKKSDHYSWSTKA